ncbi:MAG: YbaB/EbfC family nucleoid-associated protein [Candidatus Aminicenantes bacterium]|nr:YbaB/EbfC family nucleoid-associated protein [Candidatus Aminicenantes bacterium]MDH5714941.1 YbaB/EbfC family nucleoid-associated protein [Candidatus Aminicenantes bacterium]
MKDFGKFLKRAQELQKQIQEKMESMEVESSSGGGMVTVRMNGKKELLSIEIDPEVVTDADREMLQDLILAAVNDASRKVDEALAEELGGLTGGLKIPGLF